MIGPLPLDFVEGVLRERGAAGQSWLNQLPALLTEILESWQLQLEEGIWHGYLGLVFPVRQRCGQTAALKLTWVDQDTRWEAQALQRWSGRGAVQLFRADQERGVLLMERLHSERSLEKVELESATRIAARLLRQLAVEVGPDWGCMETEVRILQTRARQRWASFGQPFPSEWLDLPDIISRDCLVNHDLHFGNVLSGPREDWLVIDPKVLRGELEFGVAPLLWNRTSEGDLGQRLDWIVEEAALDRERALQWVRFRSVEYWLWALEKGLNDGPQELARWASRELLSG